MKQTKDEEPKSPKLDNDGKVPKKYNRNKIKYVCPDCKCKVWGKADLNLNCNNCACAFEVEIDDKSDWED